jgi:putative aldouronate transport system permease protein
VKVPTRRRRIRKTAGDYLVGAVAHIVVILAMIITLYPFLYALSSSISEPLAVLRGNVILWPVGFSLAAYKEILGSADIWRDYYNTLWYTVVGTALNVIVTCITAYPLSRRKFFARNFFMVLFTVPMFIGGGLIPFFLVVVNTGLYNSRLAMVIPGLISVWNLIICRTFFQLLPEELIESALMDGSTPLRTLLRIVVPTSTAIVAVLVIFYGVAHWNSWFDAILFLPNSNLHPMQVYLRRVLIQMAPETMRNFTGRGENLFSVYQIKYAIAMVVIGPIVLIYPFLQKYFVKGVMIGALKG